MSKPAGVSVFFVPFRPIRVRVEVVLLDSFIARVVVLTWPFLKPMSELTMAKTPGLLRIQPMVVRPTWGRKFLESMAIR